jgi:thioredoxin-related protein
MVINRRSLLLGAAAAGAAALSPARANEGPILTADGLYREPWFLQSFLNLGDDLETARSEGKRFAVMWELKGCPYCKETHFVNFAEPRITDYIKANFEITQLNIIGSLKVTDIDDTELREKELAEKYGVRYTPTFQFFGEDIAKLKALPPQEREVARIPGYLRPDDFLGVFRYVREKGYEKGRLRDFMKNQAS